MKLTGAHVNELSYVDRPAAPEAKWTRVQKRQDGSAYDLRSYVPFSTVSIEKANGRDVVVVKGTGYPILRRDSQGDYADAADVAHMHKTFEESLQLGVMHKLMLRPDQAKVRSSTLDAAGNWTVEAESYDPELNALIRKGALTGWSIGGYIPAEARTEKADDVVDRRARRIAERVQLEVEEFAMINKSDSEPTEQELAQMAAELCGLLRQLDAVPALSPHVAAAQDELRLLQVEQRVNAELEQMARDERLREQADRRAAEQRQVMREYSPIALAEMEEQARLTAERNREIADRKRLEQAREKSKYPDSD